MASPKRREREAAARVAAHRASDEALLALAAKFARNPAGAGLVQHVTKTCRALSVGKVTRASGSVRKHARGEVQRPLGFDLAVHPMRLTPTPKHPGCATATVTLADVFVITMLCPCKEDYLSGKQLSKKPARWRVSVNGAVVGYCTDPKHAVAWARAANKRGVPAIVEDNVSRETLKQHKGA